VIPTPPLNSVVKLFTKRVKTLPATMWCIA
jgi:hypothetical protein